ncbi:MAG: NAD(+) synthase [Candidatus Omnitrophota bacterium]|jgi:NH3-dependent NAD+ synthetase
MRKIIGVKKPTLSEKHDREIQYTLDPLPLVVYNLLHMKDKIVSWIKGQVKDANAKGIVLGLSGGIDSAVVAALSQRAVGKNNVLALFMPCNSNPTDLKDAKLVAKELKLKAKLVDLSGVYNNFLKILPGAPGLAKSNLKPRLRMATLYYFANKLNYLVCGTGNKSELMVGYFCYDEKTRVLTKKGLKSYKELKPKDTVFSLDLRTNRVVESRVKKVYTFNYDDKMFVYGGRKSSKIDIMVTPNHRMLIERKGIVELCRADQLPRRSTPTPIPKPWVGTQNPSGIFKFDNSKMGVNARHFSPISIDDFLYILGLYIGDGHAQICSVNHNVKESLDPTRWRDPGTGKFILKDIPILKKKYDGYRTWFALPKDTLARSKLVAILKKNKIVYGLTLYQVWVYGKPFYKAVIKAGVGAHVKHIPLEILNYPARYLSRLLEGLLESDGDKRGHYYTVSIQLAEQIAELGCKLGKNVSIITRPARTSLRKDGVKIKCSKSYEIYIQKEGRHWIDGAKFRRIHYCGKVWCPDVPETHNLLVERNGRFIFCGNTKYGDGGVDILPIADLLKRQVRALARELNIPESVITKPPTAGLWQGQTDEGEMGITYNDLDDILDRMSRKKKQKLSPGKLKKVKGMLMRSEHKRKGADICRI